MQNLQKKIRDRQIAVIGLGYVGLPLALAFNEITNVIAYDIDVVRIDALKNGHDHTNELTAEELSLMRSLSLTKTADDVKLADTYIVTVPTPIKSDKTPNLNPILSASKLVGNALSRGDIVIYESTVFPGCTEEVCVPILEKHSGLEFNKDFFCGYSPERINPGDKTRRLTDIVKVTSGSTPEIATVVDELYAQIVSAGTHKASSIRVAEAAKVIENTQRDVNIALINELAQLFERMDLDTKEVLEAAGTKWNFLPFRPGLVGGHCIGIDPYYLTHKAKSIGYNPEMIIAGRKINDCMGDYVANRMTKALEEAGGRGKPPRVLIMGLTFKENCPDIRNSKVIDVIKCLESSGCYIDVYDPWANPEEVQRQFKISLTTKPESGQYDGIIVAVAHSEFFGLADWINSLLSKNGIIYDLKYVLTQSKNTIKL